MSKPEPESINQHPSEKAIGTDGNAPEAIFNWLLSWVNTDVNGKGALLKFVVHRFFNGIGEHRVP